MSENIFVSGTDSSMKKIAIVSDTKGLDDEGMKKIARKIAATANEFDIFNSEVIDTKSIVFKAQKFSIIHFIGGPSYKTVILAFLCKLINFRAKTILTFSNPFWDWRAKYLFKLFKPDFALATSEKWAHYASSNGVRSKFANLSGIDADRFCESKEFSKLEIQSRLNLANDKIKVLHVGHLKEDRNLSALADLQKKSNSIQVIVIGSTTTVRSNSLINELESSGCLVINDYISNIEQYYQAADCYVFPTINPRAAVQIPLSVLEALSCGCPVVSTPFGGLTKLFPTDSGMITYLENNDFNNLEDHITVAIDKGINSKFDRNMYTWTEIANLLRGIYSSI